MSETERAVHTLATFVDRARQAQAQALDFPESAIDAVLDDAESFSESAARRVLTLLTEAADYARLSGFRTPGSENPDLEGMRLQLRIVELLENVRVAPDVAVPWLTKILERHVVEREGVREGEGEGSPRAAGKSTELTDAEDQLVVAALQSISRYRAAAAPALGVIDAAREHRDREARVLAGDVGDAIRYWSEAS